VIDRKTGSILSEFGHQGRQVGEFHWLHSLAIDSRGNLYTGEVDTGNRIQRFLADEPLSGK
jgi:sugar lactone lactonase YvrE